MTPNFKNKINWKNGIYKEYIKMAKQIIIIFSYKMQYQKYQQQYAEGRMTTTVD